VSASLIEGLDQPQSLAWDVVRRVGRPPIDWYVDGHMRVGKRETSSVICRLCQCSQLRGMLPQAPLPSSHLSGTPLSRRALPTPCGPHSSLHTTVGPPPCHLRRYLPARHRRLPRVCLSVPRQPVRRPQEALHHRVHWVATIS
jgi:hypothetical protein